jgi:NTP pyrophosphatase (non-canonical NTP hydrolase)
MKDFMQELKQFDIERNWEQFHTTKNLAISISIEASELLEIFMWLKDSQTKELSKLQLEKVKDEVGDIFINLLNFCNNTGINPLECAIEKLNKNREKYPIDKVFGSAKKYDEF